MARDYWHTVTLANHQNAQGVPVLT